MNLKQKHLIFVTVSALCFAAYSLEPKKQFRNKNQNRELPEVENEIRKSSSYRIGKVKDVIEPIYPDSMISHFAKTESQISGLAFANTLMTSMQLSSLNTQQHFQSIYWKVKTELPRFEGELKYWELVIQFAHSGGLPAERNELLKKFQEKFEAYDQLPCHLTRLYKHFGQMPQALTQAELCSEAYNPEFKYDVSEVKNAFP